jgi:hypothetical protein
MAAWNLMAFQSRKWECRSVALTLGVGRDDLPGIQQNPDAPMMNGG